MHIIKLNVQDSIYSHIMFLLKSLNTKELEIIEDINTDKEDIDYELWSQEEILNIGKAGLDSKSFVEDKEDYSKW